MGESAAGEQAVARQAERLLAEEPHGAHYLTPAGRKARRAWAPATAAFAGLAWGSYSPKDPNERLDTNAIRALMIGLNTPRDAAWLEVRNIRLIRLRGP